MELSVIIPAYNEAKRIGATLESVGAWLKRQPFDSEIVVVDNNSTDGTADVAREYHQQFPAIRVIAEKRPGKGYAVAAGMQFATGARRLFMDADNSTTIDHLDIMMPFIESGYDVVIGSLAVPGAVVLSGGQEPLWRRLLGKAGNMWIQLWAVPGIWDTQRGFKLFTARAAQDIFSRITIGGWGFDVEALAIARVHGYRIKEIPVTWKNAADSKVNVWAYPQVLMQTVQVFWNRMKGTYGKRI
jgi:glycosyltransferase involved in cell wall biosynthesis